MASDSGQQQDASHHHPQQQQQQQQHHHSLLGNANGYSPYANTNGNGATSYDDFSTFFNVPAEDSIAQKSMSSTWNPNAVDPRLQQAAYEQQSSSWNPSSFQQNSMMGTTGQTLGASDMSVAFRPNSNHLFSGSNFSNARDPYTTNVGLPSYYQQNIEYSANGYMPQHYSYGNNVAQGQSSGQTISPSALQGYPESASQQSGYPQPAPQTNPSNIAYYGKSQNSRSALRTFDDSVANEFLYASPAGTPKARGLVKNIEALQAATKSKSIGNFLLVSNEVFNTDPITGVSGKIEMRKSLNGMKRKTEEQQSGRPWENAQLPLLKRIKFTQRTTKPLAVANETSATVELPSSEDEASSEEDSEYESDEDVDEVSPLPITRPSDPYKAIAYDVIKIVWFKRTKHLGGNTIREALGAYWNLIKLTRDKWKREIAAGGEVENNPTKVEEHKAAASRYRTILDSAFRATVQHGHDDVVGKLSQNVNLFLSFYQILVDRFKESDFNGETVNSILNLMVRCTSTNAALLEKTKLDKILPRLMKKGDAKVREMLNKIEETVKANSENGSGSAMMTKSEDVPPATVKPNKTTTVSSKPASATTTTATKVVNPTAKPAPATKPKTTTISNTSKASAPLNKPTVSTNKSIPTKSGTKNVDATTVTVAKAKTAPATTPSMFAGLQSASKKPGTSNAAQKAVPASESKVTKPVEEKKPSAVPPATKSFSFADAFASIGQTKEVAAKKKVEDDKPLETEEERKRRERKEQRRSLRVRWKPEALLVETRYFKHDPEEETGHNSNMLRDVADVKNEGQMLKLHKEMRVDEEEDLPEESELAPWHLPSLIDHSGLPDDAKQDNYEMFGGSKQLVSPERIVQEQRERSIMLAIYTSIADIPSSPREPLDPYSGPIEKEVEFGWSDDPKLKEIRRREAAYFASQQQSSSATTASIQNILSILQQGQQQQQQHQPVLAMQGFPTFGHNPPPVPVQASQHHQPAPQPGSLEWIMSQIGQQKTPQVAAPPPPLPPPPASEPSAISPAILQALTAFQNMQQNQPQSSSYQTPAPPPPVNPMTQTRSTDLGAILAQISAGQQKPYSQASGHIGDSNKKRSYDDSQYGENKRARGDRVK